MESRASYIPTPALAGISAAQNEAPAPDLDLLTEISNLRQECAELHELIAVQRETIDRLQRELRRERISAMQAAGAAALIRSIYSTRTRTHQTLVRVGGGA